jgi:hypothetical protein
MILCKTCTHKTQLKEMEVMQVDQGLDQENWWYGLGLGAQIMSFHGVSLSLWI